MMTAMMNTIAMMISFGVICTLDTGIWIKRFNFTAKLCVKMIHITVFIRTKL